MLTKIKKVIVGVRGGSNSAASMDFPTVNFPWQALRCTARQITSTSENKMILCALQLYSAANPLNFLRLATKHDDHRPGEL